MRPLKLVEVSGPHDSGPIWELLLKTGPMRWHRVRWWEVWYWIAWLYRGRPRA